MSLWLKQSTARTIHIGPFVDDTDGKTAETALTISQADVRLSKNGGDIAQKNDATSCTHDELGYYTCPLDTTDTNTLGHLKLMVHESGALPVFMDFMVVPANVWDSMFGSDKLQVDVEEIGAGMITATAIADAAIDLATFAADCKTGSALKANVETVSAGAITAAAIATDAIDADAIKADAVTEIQSGLATSAEIAAVKGDTAAILADTGTDGVVVAAASKTGYALTAAYDPAKTAAQASTALSNATWTDVRAGKLDNLDAAISTRLATAGYTAPPTAAANADAVWDELVAEHAGAGSAGATLAAASAPSAAVVADAVWDEALAGHAGAGSAGSALSAAGSAGDPWSTLIPGAYGAGTAGKKLGDLATDQADGGRTDLLIDAIKAKTDTIGSLSVTITSPVATDGTVTIEQGDSYNGIVGGTLPISVLKSGIPYDLTGASARFKCDQATFGPVAIIDDGTNWVATFEPTAAQTATLTMLSQPCEVEASWPDGKIKTYLRGTLRVNRDIPAVS